MQNLIKICILNRQTIVKLIIIICLIGSAFSQRIRTKLIVENDSIVDSLITDHYFLLYRVDTHVEDSLGEKLVSTYIKIDSLLNSNIEINDMLENYQKVFEKEYYRLLWAIGDDYNNKYYNHNEAIRLYNNALTLITTDTTSERIICNYFEILTDLADAYYNNSKFNN